MSSIKATVLFLFGAVLLFPGKAAAQELLTLEEAIRIGLQNNYAIQIAARDEAIASNNVTLGNAGFLPAVDGRGTRTYRSEDTKRVRLNGEETISNGTTSNNLNGSVNLNWTVFDGMGMFINYDRLQALEKSGELFTRETVENSLADITDAYFEVVRQEYKIKAIQDAIEISKARIELVEAQYEVGVSAKVEILRAQVDYNADQSELLNQQESLQNAKINLNQLLGRDPNINFVAQDTINVERNLTYNGINDELTAANPLLQRLQVNRELANLDVKAVRASRFPVIGVTSAYNFSRTEADPVDQLALLYNQNKGLVYGLTLSVPIFNGFNINRQAQNARIAVEAADLEFRQVQNQLQAELARAYSRYTNRLQLLDLEESNLVLAEENAKIALERYRLGLLTSIELREAQRNQLVAENRLIDIRYEAKAAETELKRLSSSLVTDL